MPDDPRPTPDTGLGDGPDPDLDAGFRPPGATPARIVAGLLVLVGILLPLLVWTYAKDAPRLNGWPFFYWYQLLLVPITAVLCGIAYVVLRSDDRKRRAAEAGAGAGAGEERAR